MIRTSLLLAVVVAALSSWQIDARMLPADDAGLVMARFLEQQQPAHAYRAARHLEATGSGQQAWLEAETDFAPATGLTYEVTSEGGSGYIRSRVLRKLLEEEQELIARGGTAAVALTPENYRFTSRTIGADGLAEVDMEPKRKERALIAGTLFLDPADSSLVRVEGRLAKSPSFWVSRVSVVRSYQTINGVLVPVSLDSVAQLRLLGRSTLRMTYNYATVDGAPATPK